MHEVSQASLNDIWKASLLLYDSITTNHQVWWQICELTCHCTVLVIPFDFSSKKCIYPWNSTESSLNFCRHSVELNLFIHKHLCCFKSLCRCADSGCGHYQCADFFIKHVNHSVIEPWKIHPTSVFVSDEWL